MNAAHPRSSLLHDANSKLGAASSVADSAGFLPRAFDRFTQADAARTTTGTGLGLAITAAIARAAGGTYGAANHPDGGATVWIALPARVM